jgi:AraC family transcriptional regulator of adaptative response / DNA-3-methyladenine glycosylase II
MDLSSKVCERAYRSRDYRFDGRFFIGVSTTGIYCRPICPAPRPKRENVRFYSSAAAAAEAGLRPCLRCRPEASPGTPAWLGTSSTVSRALRLIEGGVLDDGSVGDLARLLGIGPRHLSRLFREHLGATPVAIAQTRRLHFAKKLLDETDLSMADVAFSSGFGSIRRFNAAFRKAYDRRPSELRRAAVSHSSATQEGLTLSLSFRPPYDWDSLAEFLALRAIPGVESVSGSAYRRTIAFGSRRGRLEIRPVEGANRLQLHLHFPDPRQLLTIVDRIRRLFDLRADPREIARSLGRDPSLATLVRTFPGLRVPGAWDGFELAVRAILGQQVSVKGASTLAGRLVETFGAHLAESQDEIGYLFPTPERLADADVESVGLPKTRGAAIRRLAQAVCRKEIVFDSPAGGEEAVRRLTRLPGIGDWTAQYIAMRAIGEPDAFPSTDLGLLRAAGDGSPLTPARLLRSAEAWRPWRAYAAMYLWRSLGGDPRGSRSTSIS